MHDALAFVVQFKRKHLVVRYNYSNNRFKVSLILLRLWLISEPSYTVGMVTDFSETPHLKTTL